MKRRVFIKKSSVLILSGLISSCASIKGSQNSLSKSQIKDKIFSELVRKPKYKHEPVFDPKEFGWDKNLTKELGFDSLDTVEFIMKLEKMFDVSIKNADAEKISTPNQGVDMVYKYLKSGAKSDK